MNTVLVERVNQTIPGVRAGKLLTPYQYPPSQAPWLTAEEAEKTLHPQLNDFLASLHQMLKEPFTWKLEAVLAKTNRSESRNPDLKHDQLLRRYYGLRAVFDTEQDLPVYTKKRWFHSPQYFLELAKLVAVSPSLDMSEYEAYQRFFYYSRTEEAAKLVPNPRYQQTYLSVRAVDLYDAKSHHRVSEDLHRVEFAAGFVDQTTDLKLEAAYLAWREPALAHRVETKIQQLEQYPEVFGDDTRLSNT